MRADVNRGERLQGRTRPLLGGERGGRALGRVEQRRGALPLVVVERPVGQSDEGVFDTPVHPATDYSPAGRENSSAGSSIGARRMDLRLRA